MDGVKQAIYAHHEECEALAKQALLKLNQLQREEVQERIRMKTLISQV